MRSLVQFMQKSFSFPADKKTANPELQCLLWISRKRHGNEIQS